MLNELLAVERGAVQAGITIATRDPGVKDVGRKPTLRVRLDLNGRVADVDPVPGSLSLWTFGKGNKQRFPFLQPNMPLMYVQSEEIKTQLVGLRVLRAEKRRNGFIEICRNAVINDANLADWPGIRDKNGNWSQDPRDYLNGLRKKRDQMIGLRGTDGESVLATIERFLMACNKKRGGLDLLEQIVRKFIENLQFTAGDDWLRVGEPLLFFGGGALFFDIPSHEFSRLASDPRQVAAISHVLQTADKVDSLKGKCALSGENDVLLVKDTFPEVVIPVIGKTILFSRFNAIPSNARYGLFGAKSFSAGETILDTLGGVLRYLTSPEREGLTWKPIPSETPKQSDLLLAFVHEVIDAPTAALFMEKEEDLSEEEGDTVSKQAASVAAFEERAKRLIEAVKANVTADWRNTPVSLAIFRKVDPANRKVIYASTPTVSDLYGAAVMWIAGERNIPHWLQLPVFIKGKGFPIMTTPRHVAPLEVTALLKRVYIRGGIDSQEITGLPASETLMLFLDPSCDGHRPAKTRARRVLRLILKRRAVLLAGVGQVLHTPESWQGQKKAVRAFNGSEGLRTTTLMGVLLHKLNRTKEVYMNETAFKLGQLLAAADVVHAGYCADVRGGDVPPSLLGNQVFAMAQSDPNKALATLCRRWKPYDGWAKKASRNTNRVSTLIASSSKDDQSRGWDIRKALRYAREMAPLAAELAPVLETCRVNDIFLAELLLGYMAGFPKTQRDDGDVADVVQDDKEEE